MFNYLLVLGLIPGTDFQITFYEYLVLLPLAAVILYARRRGVARTDLLRYWLYTKLYITIRRGGQLTLPL